MPRRLTMTIMMAVILLGLASCSASRQEISDNGFYLPDGRRLLGNSDILAISYSGHRQTVRSVENTPTVAETKEDLKILSAMGIKLLRTYNTTIFPHSERILQAIQELKQADPDFEMYVMLGAWIQCKNAFQEGVDHTQEDAEFNQREIDAAIRLVGEYPDIVKIIAVGNEARVYWQAHFVPTATILKYVKVLEEARSQGSIPATTLITTSDNWAAMGGEEQYRDDDLTELIKHLDFLSMHTYAFHDTYYNNLLQWGPLPDEVALPLIEKIDRAIARSIALQKDQYQAVKSYLDSLGVDKEIHIGETGWASLDNSHYGPEGTRAADEYIAKKFHDAVREWTNQENLSCFFFEAFDEPWKSNGTAGSEGHFGLFTVDGQAKYMVWDQVDAGRFEGLSRGGHPIRKTHGGDLKVLTEKLVEPVHLKFKP